MLKSQNNWPDISDSLQPISLSPNGKSLVCIHNDYSKSPEYILFRLLPNKTASPLVVISPTPSEFDGSYHKKLFDNVKIINLPSLGSSEIILDIRATDRGVQVLTNKVSIFSALTDKDYTWEKKQLKSTIKGTVVAGVFSKTAGNIAVLSDSKEVTVFDSDHKFMYIGKQDYYSDFNINMSQPHLFSLNFLGDEQGVYLRSIPDSDNEESHYCYWLPPYIKISNESTPNITELSPIKERNILAGYGDNLISFYDAITGDKVIESIEHDGFVTAADVLEKDLFATGTVYGDVRIWKKISATLPEIKKPQQIENSSKKASEYPLLIAISPDKKKEIWANGEPRNYNFIIKEVGKKDKEINPPKQWEGFRSASFSSDSSKIIMTGANGLDGSTPGATNEGAIVYSSSTLDIDQKGFDHEGCWRAKFSSDGKNCATIGNGFVQIWNTTTREVEKKLLHDNVTHILWNRMKSKLVTISEGKNLKLWNLANSGLIKETPWPIHMSTKEFNFVYACGYFEDGHKLFFVCSDSYVSVWDSISLECIVLPTRANDLKINTNSSDILKLLPWLDINFNADAASIKLLASYAETISGIRILEDGTIEKIVNPVKEFSAHINNISLVDDNWVTPILTNFKHHKLEHYLKVNDSEIEINLDEANILINLQKAIFNYSSPPYNDSWALNRDRLDYLDKEITQFKKQFPSLAKKVIPSLFEDWETRTDSVAILTLWHCGERAKIDQEKAVRTFTELVSNLSEDEKDDEQMSKWIDDWKADLGINK